MSLRTVIYRNFEKIPFGREEWNSLASENEINSIFQTYDWTMCWWSVFGNNCDLFLIAVYDQADHLIGIAPLCITKDKSNSPTLVFIGDGNADYVDFIIPGKKEDIIYLIFTVIKQHKSLWKLFLLSNIPEHSSSYGILTKLLRTRQYNLCLYKETLCPSLVVHNRERGAKHLLNKYSVKRPYNYFRKSGNLKHVIFEDLDEAFSHINIFFEQHIKRWENTPNPSLFNKEKNRQFYIKLLNSLLLRKELLFSAIIYNDLPIAYHFGFDFNSVVTWYKPSYSVKYAKRSPGTLMVKYLIEYALEHNRGELDFTIGDEPFKDRFANMYRYNVTMIYFPSKWQYKKFELYNILKNIIKFFIKRKIAS